MLVLSLLTIAAGALAAPAVELAIRQDAPAECTTKWNGTAITGVKVNESCRYTVRYGTADRWTHPVPATTQDGQNAAEFPPMCPQANGTTEGRTQSEDCLQAVIYTPANMSTAADAAKLPVFVWVHGGSYINGGASQEGNDGTEMAPAGNMILVFIQYRLGVLGFLPPSSAPTNDDPNYGTRDAILALQSVQTNIGAVGGDPAKVTVGGESAGASLIRSLLGAPAAKGLYRGVILQSDPNNYGTQLAEHRDGLQKMVFGNESISNCTDFACFQKLPFTSILTVQQWVNSKAPTNLTGIPLGEVFRPQASTETIPNDPANLLLHNPSSLSVDIANVPLLITTTKNETGYIINGVFSSPFPAVQNVYELALKTFFNPDRAKIVIDSGLYPLINSTDGLRESIEHVATDGAFRCVNRELARRYAGAGGKVWVGEWQEGVSYSFNTMGYCKEDGVVCHADDLYPTFGTTPAENDTAQTASLESQVRRSWVSFITDGTPAPEGVNWPGWTSNSTDADVHALGNGTVSTCPADFWGVKVNWDFQLYSNTTNSTATTGNGATPSSPGGKPGGAASGLGVSAVLATACLSVALLF